MKATWPILFTIISIQLYVSDVHGRLQSSDAIATRLVLESNNRVIDILNNDKLFQANILRTLIHAILHKHENIRVYIDDLIVSIKDKCERIRNGLEKRRKKTERTVYKHVQHNDQLKILLLETAALAETIKIHNHEEQSLIETLRTACDKVENNVHERIPTAKWVLEIIIDLRDKAPWAIGLVEDNFIELLKGCGISDNESIELKEFISNNERDEGIWRNYLWKRRDTLICSSNLEIEASLQEVEG